MDFAASNDYEQYEISNFSKPTFISKHNSAYWLGEKYMGIGPSAHSFNGSERSWNVANNPKYMQCIKKGLPFNEKEELSTQDRFNEYILTRLRTKWGIVLADLETISSEMLQVALPTLNQYIADGSIQENASVFTLTNSGKYIADAISADLFSS